jgi:hypothetical protein
MNTRVQAAPAKRDWLLTWNRRRDEALFMCCFLD